MVLKYTESKSKSKAIYHQSLSSIIGPIKSCPSKAVFRQRLLFFKGLFPSKVLNKKTSSIKGTLPSYECCPIPFLLFEYTFYSKKKTYLNV